MTRSSRLKLIIVPLGIFVFTLLLIEYFRAGSEPSSVAVGTVPVSEKPGEIGPSGPPEKKSSEPAERSDPPRHVANEEEDAFAVAVDGEPLLVILPWYEEIGKISIEKYDKEGNATGKPLKSGAMVQIPDPFLQGERIRFVVP